MNLIGEQLRVLSESGNLLVTGGPGSGKTTAGLLKARAVISRGLADHTTVLFLSFSHSAIFQIQQAAKINLASSERKQLAIHTFHSFCWEVLQAHGALLGLKVPLTVIPPEEETIARTLHANWESHRKELATQFGRVAFDLFAPLTADLFRRSQKIRELYGACYPLVIVDEFQDTDDAQWQVLSYLTEKSELVALADPDQRIYDFRPGVHGRRLQEFLEEKKPTPIDLKDSNHRSPGSDIATFARHVLEPSRGAFRSTAVKVETYDFPNVRGLRLKYAIQNNHPLQG